MARIDYCDPAKASERTREILDKKFEEAKKRAAADPTGRPPNPFDNE